MPYQGKNFDPLYHQKKGLPKPAAHDAVKPKQPKKSKIAQLFGPKPCRLVGLDGSRIEFTKKKDAKRALAALILTLPPKASKNDPDQYWIEDIV